MWAWQPLLPAAAQITSIVNGGGLSIFDGILHASNVFDTLVHTASVYAVSFHTILVYDTDNG